MALSDVVRINISRQTTQVSRAGFGVGLIAGPATTFGAGELVRTYKNITEVAVDFADTTDEYKAAEKYFSQPNKPEKLKIGKVTTPVAPATIAPQLSAIDAVDADWYALALIDNTKDNVLAAASWCEARRKIQAVRTDDNTVKAATTTDVAAALKAAKYDRTFVIYHSNHDDFAECAWMGSMLPLEPGTNTWNLKALNGVTADNLTGTERTNLDTKNANYYIRIGGVPATQEGVMASGEYIDIVIGIDWLEARMSERIFSTMINQKKVPFTNQGINLIVSDVRTQLQLAVGVGLINDDFNVVAPKASETDKADRIERTLRGVRFDARLQGAIHKAIIEGTVTV